MLDALEDRPLVAGRAGRGHRALPGHRPPAGRRARGARAGAARRRGPLRARAAAGRARSGGRRGDPAGRRRPAPRWPSCATTTGESVQFYVRDGDRRVCVAALESPHGLRTIVPMGAVLPLDVGARPARCSLPADAGSAADRRAWAESVGEREAGVASVQRRCATPTVRSSPRSASRVRSSAPAASPAAIRRRRRRGRRRSRRPPASE